MNDEQYLAALPGTAGEFAKTLSQRTEHLRGGRPSARAGRGLPAAGSDSDADCMTEGPALVARLFTTYPDFAPTFPRELLWFFGGDCLHFMPDDEIAMYQQLEEQRWQAAARGEIFDLRAARAKLLKLQ